MGFKSRAIPAAAEPASVVTSSTVDGYVGALPEPVRAVAAQLREWVRRAAPDSSEGIKWNVPVFELKVPFCYLSAHGSYVRLGFYRGAELDDPGGLLEGTGARLRHVKVAVGAPAPRAALEALLRRAAALAT